MVGAQRGQCPVLNAPLKALTCWLRRSLPWTHKRLSPNRPLTSWPGCPSSALPRKREPLGWHQAALQSSAQRPQPPPAHPAAYQRPWRCLLFLPVPSGKLSCENRTGSLRSCGCQVLASPRLVGLLKTELEQAEPGCLATLRGQRVPRSQRSGLNARSRARGGRARAGSQGERGRLAARQAQRGTEPRSRSESQGPHSHQPVGRNHRLSLLSTRYLSLSTAQSKSKPVVACHKSLGRKRCFRLERGLCSPQSFSEVCFPRKGRGRVGCLVCLCLFLFSPLVIRLATLIFWKTGS